MLNMIDTQDKLKNFSEAQLIGEMQQPSGSAPQFMVLGEIDRRKRMRQDATRQEGLMQPTVAQEAISGAGVPQQGLAGLAQSLAPKTDMTQNTGVPNAQAANLPAQPNQPQKMADGGVLRLALGGSMSGGTLSAIANLKVMRPDLYEEHKDDPEMLALTAEYYLTVAKDPEMTGLEATSAPRKNDLIKRMFSDPTQGMVKDQQKRDARNFGDDYELDQRARSLINQRQAELAGNEGLFAEGAPVDYIAGNTSAGFGGSTVPFPAADTPLRDLPMDGGLGAFTMPDETPITLPSADRGIRSMSGATNPGMVGGDFDPLPTESIANAKADAQRDDTLRFLRGAEGAPTDNRSLIDAIDRDDGLANSDEVISDNMGIRSGLFFPQSFPEVTSLNRRAQEYMQSDMYTPPEEIYDLGPRGVLKYEEAGDEEFTSSSDKLAREAAAGEQATSEASLIAQDVASDAEFTSTADRQAEARRMRRINEIPEKGYRTLAQKQKEADFAAANPFVAEVIDPIVETSIAGAGLAGRTAADLFGYGVDNLPGYIDEVAYARGFGDRAERKRADAAEETLMGMPVAADPNKSAIQLENEKQASAKALAAIVAEDKPSGGKGGGTSAGSGQGRIADLIASRKKEADQNKWLALAQAGMSLMSTGDFGKAGQEGLAALMAQRESMNKFDTDMIKLESDLVLNNARLEAARRTGKGGGALTANQLLSRGNDLIKSGQSMLEDAGDNADAVLEAQNLIAAGRELIRRVTGGRATAGLGVTQTPSATKTG